jgi:hypothetical protein
MPSHCPFDHLLRSILARMLFRIAIAFPAAPPLAMTVELVLYTSLRPQTKFVRQPGSESLLAYFSLVLRTRSLICLADPLFYKG